MCHPRHLVRIELAGAVVMIVLGSALHFVFDLFGGWRPLALFAAVNESIWEHLKLAFWPGVLWAAVMPLPEGLARREVFAAKGVSLLVTAVLIVAIFKGYTVILGRNLLVLDISTFALAIVAGQLLSAALLAARGRWRRALLGPGPGLLALQLAAYCLFTYVPPDHWLFIEAGSGNRGI